MAGKRDEYTALIASTIADENPLIRMAEGTGDVCNGVAAKKLLLLFADRMDGNLDEPLWLSKEERVALARALRRLSRASRDPASPTAQTAFVPDGIERRPFGDESQWDALQEAWAIAAEIKPFEFDGNERIRSRTGAIKEWAKVTLKKERRITAGNEDVFTKAYDARVQRAKRAFKAIDAEIAGQIAMADMLWPAELKRPVRKAPRKASK